ncbi:T9SS type A sorting domain-containing protein [Polluticoccus soli]|uniref:T9SS type A sorting domain-containing protein n=1 Tax=Polluticoccus soli TaxID=3034150 RepID=UPI0023E23989|nr:T9SS type A sorting domain-containing protein [Flavipsychrobacter sp. JY13-12]
MKKTITLFALLVTVLTNTYAQIPNGSFENWTTATGYSTPDGWDNFNPLTTSYSVYTCEKGTTSPPHGNAFLMLTTKVVGTSTVPGLAMLGKYDAVTQKPKSGVPFTGRPSHLTGKWQYMAFGTDTGRIAVYLTKWNNTTLQRDLIGQVEYDLPGMVMSWTSFAIPITYVHGTMPDSVIIGLISSNKSSNAAAGSYLYVDSLNFTGSVPDGISEITDSKYSITLSPNPAKDNLSVDFGAVVSEDVILQVIDIYGRTVTQATWARGQRVYSMQLNTVATGSYFVRSSVGEEIQMQRLVIE